jgi:hypothetical protein
MSEPILQAMEKLQRELDETRSELVESQKDFLCLATLLDGHDATECRMNLVEIIEQRDRLEKALCEGRKLAERYEEIMREMWPFIEEDYYPNCCTAEFNRAVIRYKQALEIP